MNHSFETFIGPRDCEFKDKDDVNLAALRRVKVKLWAESLNVDGDGPKNEVLKRVIVRLRALGAPEDLSDWVMDKPKKTVRKKTTKKAA